MENFGLNLMKRKVGEKMLESITIVALAFTGKGLPRKCLSQKCPKGR